MILSFFLIYIDDMLIIGGKALRITSLKIELSKYFAMKYLGHIVEILSMKITHDKKIRRLWLSQEKYIEKKAQNQACEYPSSSTLQTNTDHSSKKEKQKKVMEKIPYVSAIGSLMYSKFFIKPDITHFVGGISRFVLNPRKEHWHALKDSKIHSRY